MLSSVENAIRSIGDNFVGLPYALVQAGWHIRIEEGRHAVRSGSYLDLDCGVVGYERLAETTPDPPENK